MKNKWGYEERDWNKAKAEATAILIEIAKARGRIPYSELAPKIQAISFDADEPRFWHLLGEISVEEVANNRGMLSALVVHKSGNMRPGSGFYKLAEGLLKKKVSQTEVDRLWLKEFNRVHDVWANRKGSPAVKEPGSSR
jgi:hypothetical protein